MSKLNSPSSNNSATSSETSETQSVEENPQGGINTPYNSGWKEDMLEFESVNENDSPNDENQYIEFWIKATKNWKKLKDLNERDKDDKKPPWRAVSVSTLPKPDKNALLRAKLLDASRRLRPGRSSVGVQTDLPPTTLMKEVNHDVQHDLIAVSDKAILTDGSVTMKHEHPGEFILTHSVAQMTECILARDMQTQTATPRAANLFLELNQRNTGTLPHKTPYNFKANEELLFQQIREIQRIDEKLGWTKFKNPDEDNISEDSLNLDDSGGPLPYQSTQSSWIFDDDVDTPRQPIQPYTSQNDRPWSSFHTTSSDQSHMKLWPLHDRLNRNSRKTSAHPVWTEEHVRTVVDMLNESNALVRSFRTAEALMTPKVVLKDIPREDNFEVKFLSDYWEPILTKSREELVQKLKSLKYPQKNVFEKLKPLEDV